MKKFLSGIKSEIETINSGEEMHYEKHNTKIMVDTDDDFVHKFI